MTRLQGPDSVVGSVAKPAYDREATGAGIVHLGFGAFHRAHQAYYCDEAMNARGGDWRIVGASLRSTAGADDINAQNGWYTLLERGSDRSHARLVGSVETVIAISRDGSEALLSRMANPAIRIVSLTVTEKAYGIDRAAKSIDPAHPAIAADLVTPEKPISAVGLIVEALRRRRDANVEPFTVLCCDNLPDNGVLVQAGVIDFARRVRPELAAWIEAEVTFPCTMVDRITPAMTPESYAEVADAIGCEDRAAIITEPFTQWVIEDRFPTGRPAWDEAGAIMVDDVAPFELMKLRMLNGAHSMLAYAGFMAGHKYVRDVMADADLPKLVRRHFAAAAATLEPPSGFDLDDYALALAERFENTSVAHETYQIAMDGTEKLPQRLLQPAAAAQERGQPLDSFAFAAAAWMRYCLGVTEDGAAYELRDPRQDRIGEILAETGRDATAMVTALQGLDGVFPAQLANDPAWTGLVVSKLTTILSEGMCAAIALEAKDA